MAAWERSKICCTPAAMDVETKVGLLPTISAVRMVLLYKHIVDMGNSSQQVFPCPVWGTGDSGFIFKQTSYGCF